MAVATLAVPTETGYTLPRAIAVWAAAALPMGFLGWVVAPSIAPDLAVDAVGAVAARFGALTVGLAWLVVLALFVVRQEEGDLRWATVRRRLRLTQLRSPRTGQPCHRPWLWLVHLVVLVAIWQVAVGPRLNALWVALFPFFAEPASFSLGAALASPAVKAQFVGAWGLLALFAVSAVLNTFGEELLFRGALLPKLDTLFGRWDWLAVGVLFGAYHLHQPWGIPGSIGTGALFYALPAKIFRSTLISIAVHSVQSIYFLFLILGLVLGLA